MCRAKGVSVNQPPPYPLHGGWPPPRGPAGGQERRLTKPFFGKSYALSGANANDQGPICDVDLTELLPEATYYGGSWVVASREQIGSFVGVAGTTFSDALVVCQFASGGVTNVVEFDAGQAIQLPAPRVTCFAKWAGIRQSDGTFLLTGRPDETIVSVSMMRGASHRHATRSFYFNQLAAAPTTFAAVTVPAFATGVAVQTNVTLSSESRRLAPISPTARLRMLAGASGNQTLAEYFGGALAQTNGNAGEWLPVPEGTSQFDFRMPRLPTLGDALARVVFRIEL